MRPNIFFFLISKPRRSSMMSNMVHAFVTVWVVYLGANAFVHLRRVLSSQSRLTTQCLITCKQTNKQTNQQPVNPSHKTKSINDEFWTTSQPQLRPCIQNQGLLQGSVLHSCLVTKTFTRCTLYTLQTLASFTKSKNEVYNQSHTHYEAHPNGCCLV